MSDDVNRQLVLIERPVAEVERRHFELRSEPVPEPGDGEFLVRVCWLGFDPTQRGWLNDVPSYIPPVQIGEVMRSSGAGQVVASNHPDYVVGELVSGNFGWQDYAISDGQGLTGRVAKIPPGVPPTWMLGPLGVTGLTAYFGMLDVAGVGEGDQVLVSGAAGATGSVAGQIARIRGAAKVVGLAGGPEKCAWVTDVAGYDVCIDYRNEDVGRRLREEFPKGMDVYFDNVGGPILDDALMNLALNARIALCGAISTGYDVQELPPGPKNYAQLIIKRSKIEGFLVLDFVPRFGEAIGELAGWLTSGEIKVEEDLQEGLENAPATLARLFTGANLGKQLLTVAEPPLPLAA